MTYVLLLFEDEVMSCRHNLVIITIMSLVIVIIITMVVIIMKIIDFEVTQEHLQTDYTKWTCNVCRIVITRVYNRKEGEYPTHYSTVYHPFTGVSDLSSNIHNLWFHTTPLTTTYIRTWLYTKQLQVQLD